MESTLETPGTEKTPTRDSETAAASVRPGTVFWRLDVPL